MKHAKYNSESPEVIAILTGIYRSSDKNYFRITDTGKHEICAVRKRLMALGIGTTSATRIMKAANIPVVTFIQNKTPKPVIPDGIIRKVKADVEVYSPVEQDLAPTEVIAEPQLKLPKKGRQRKPQITELADEELTDEQIEEKATNSKRYCLVQQGAYWGAYDEESSSQVLFRSKQEALNHIHQLLHDKDVFRIQYGHCRQTSRKLEEFQEEQGKYYSSRPSPAIRV
jgi:hypothetical protein